MREVCFRCWRPRPVCYCALLPSLPTRTRVVLLQHPRERRVGIGTARMAHLALPNSELHEGVVFEDDARIAALAADPTTAVLFPGGDADPAAGPPVRSLIVVDGTWGQARKMLALNPRLASVRRPGGIANGARALLAGEPPESAAPPARGSGRAGRTLGWLEVVLARLFELAGEDEHRVAPVPDACVAV
ncbi:tRNA-uridine aminocarboxypropyltransferase [Sorangium sp. So ce315]|uniref:tRNA-uridine aminocarboxypropyltransferase n=1 Tax=Sorangium sp. So ce315 TaxID=3133299 RepID=UPI003F5EDCF6